MIIIKDYLFYLKMQKNQFLQPGMLCAVSGKLAALGRDLYQLTLFLK